MEASTALPVELLEEERRVVPRHAVTVPVAWPGGTGTTRDLGRLGACFVSETGCVPGETLALRLALPSPRPGKILYAICKGQVVRAEQRGPGEGNATAVAFRDVSFEGFGADGGFGWLDQGLYDV